MFQISPLYRIPDEIIKAIKVLYTNTKAKVLTTDRDTEIFDIYLSSSRRHSCSLSFYSRAGLRPENLPWPKQYLRSITQKTKRNPAQYLTDLDFSDDLTLIAKSISNAELLLHSLEEACSAVGHICNDSKTEFISTSSNQDSLKASSGGDPKRVEDFKYPGFFVMDSNKDFKTRKDVASQNWTRFGAQTSTKALRLAF